MTAPLLSVHAAEFFRGQRKILQGIDLEVASGETVALLGPSGSGKTTLLRTIAGLERLADGEIRTPDQALDDGRTFVRPNARGFGLVFQDGALFPHMTAARNIAFGLAKLPKPQRHAEALIWLDRVGLAHRASAYPHELSGGEQQRVALARALAPKPKLILLDEPFSSLDRSLRDELRRSTAQLLAASGTSAILVTHDAEEAMDMATRIVLMEDGRILQSGAPQSLYDRPETCAAARLLGTANIWSGVVKSGALDTPVGRFAAPGLAEGDTACLIVRPQHLSLQSGVAMTVASRTFKAGKYEIVALASDGSEWRASVQPDRLPENERAGLSASPSDVVIVRG